jgi:hypothetical protein
MTSHQVCLVENPSPVKASDPDNQAWIQGYAVPRITPFDLQPNQIDIEDIARGLSRIARFNGMTHEFYSVAQHSSIGAMLIMDCARELGGDEIALSCARQFLLHDAPEYLIGDMVRPIKHSSTMQSFRALEDDIWQVIARKFDVPQTMMAGTQWMDEIMLHWERKTMLTLSDDPTWGGGEPDEISMWDLPEIYPKSCNAAMEDFLKTFKILFPEFDLED